MKTVLFIISVCTLCFACESATHIDKEAEIEKKVQERLEEFRSIIAAKCKRKILEEASVLADSIILQRARTLKDSLAKPIKPIRPEKPDLLQLKDSLALAPLFDTSINVKPGSSTLDDF